MLARWRKWRRLTGSEVARAHGEELFLFLRLGVVGDGRLSGGPWVRYRGSYPRTPVVSRTSATPHSRHIVYVMLFVRYVLCVFYWHYIGLFVMLLQLFLRFGCRVRRYIKAVNKCRHFRCTTMCTVSVCSESGSLETRRNHSLLAQFPWYDS